ncbi:MAG: hypothetical protein KIT09_23185 [Bryobacteraceae bacterium]|nr:hypothetical protein [Bryobacteraceae bacterium]
MGIGGKAVWKTVVIIGLAAQTAAAQENLHGNSVQPALIHDLAGVPPGTLAAAKA